MTITKPPSSLTVLIGTKNEARNIAACLNSVQRATRRIVVDSHSSDDTATIAATNGAEVIQFSLPPDGPKKRQWAMDNVPIDSAWILLLDADERVPTRLWDEIETAISGSQAPAAFAITKGFHFLGKKFRFGGFSHSAVVLLRPGRARFETLLAPEAGEPDMEIHERLRVDGPVKRLETPLIHNDEKGLEAYKARHADYARWEARLRAHYFATGQWGSNGIRPNLFGDVQQRRRWLKLLSVRIPLEPLWWFAYHYLARGAVLEGRSGYLASYLRAQYIADIRRRTKVIDS